MAQPNDKELLDKIKDPNYVRSVLDGTLDKSVEYGVKQNPQSFAQTSKAAKQLNIPIDVAERQSDEVKRVAREKEILKKIQDTEYVKKALANPDFSAIAHNDVDALTKIEKTAKATGAGAIQATLGMSESILRTPSAARQWLEGMNEWGKKFLPQWMTEKVLPDPFQPIERGLWVGGKQIVAGMTDAADAIRESTQKLAKDPATFGETFNRIMTKGAEADQAFSKAVQGDIEPLANVITDPEAWAGFIGQAAPSLYTAYKSGGSIPFIAWLEGMEAANDAAEFEKITGQRIDPRMFMQATAQAAGINAVLEKFGLDKVFGQAGKGVLSSTLKGALVEGGTEGLQQFNSNLAALLAYNPEKDLSEGVIGSIMGGAGTGGPMGGLSAIGRASGPNSEFSRNAIAADRAHASKKSMDTLVEEVKKTELHKIDPEVTKQFLDDVLGADNNVFINFEDADGFFQSHPEIFEKLPKETAEAIRDSIGLSTDVVIPKSEYITYFNEYHDQLSDVIRNDQDGMSVKEANEFETTLAEDLDQKLDTMFEEGQKQADFEQSAQKVHEDIKAQIMRTGRFKEDVADRYAALHTAFAKVAAKKTGRLPYEAYFEIGLTVKATPVTGEKLTQEPAALKENDRVMMFIADEEGNKEADIGHVRIPGEKESVVATSDDTWVTVKNEDLELMDEGRLFQKERGFYQPDTNIIGLLQDADLSSFLHETGHFFLETISRMPEFQEEMDSTLKWFMLDRPTWDSMSLEDKREYHEQFARGFEAYLMEGKAPSLELRDVFQRFRDWLVNIYRSLRNLNVPMTQEIRQVFDRLLATDDQIREAEAARAYEPLFKSIEDAGMTENQWSEYQRLEGERRDQARDELQTRSLKDMKWMSNAKAKALREIQKSVKGKRAAIREQVAKDVSRETVYQAIRFFRRGEVLDENDELVTFDNHRLDIDAVEQLYEGVKTTPKDTVAPEVDTLMVAIAKLGGVKKSEAEQQGIDPAHWKGRDAITSNQPVFGKRIFREDGLTFDDMATIISQYGYEMEGANDLLEAISSSLMGKDQYSNQVDWNLVTSTYEWVDWRKLGYGKFGMLAKDGVDPEDAAHMFGYSSADLMIQEMLEAPDQKEYIDAVTDQRMLETYGDITNPVAMERAAEEAIHNDVHTRMLHTELRALTVGQREKNVLAKAAKQYAEQAIANKKVRDIKPNQYMAAQTRAGNNALKALGKGDHDSAVDHKRAQVLNNHFYRAANDASKYVDKKLNYLRKFSKEGVRKNLDTEYLEQIDDLLAQFDIRAMSDKAAKKRQTLSEFIKQQEEENSFQPAIDEALVEEAKRQHYKNMTYSQFRGMVETIEMIEHLGRLKKKLLTAKDQREFNQRMDEAKRSIELLRNRQVKERGTATDVLGQVGQWGRQFAAIHRKFSSIIREMDGNKDGGIMWNLFLRTMNEAGDNEIEMHQQATEKLSTLFDALDLRTGFGNIYAVKRVIPGTDISLTDEQRIMVAMNWGNEGNRQRLVDGGFPGKRQITEADIQKILDTLSKKEWDFVQGVFDFLEEYRTQVGEQEKRLTGKTPKWVESAPIETRYGTYRGGYFPAKYDAQLSDRASILEAVTDLRMAMKGMFGAAATRSGYTKQRAQAIKDRPLLLTFDTITQHVNEVTHRLAWQDWITDANRSIKALAGTIQKYYGKENLDEMRKSIEDIAKGDTPATNAFERFINHIRVGTTIVGMGFRVTTAAIQPTGFAQSFYRVGRPWMIKGMRKFISNPLEASREANEKSKLMRDRDRTMMREMNEVLTKIRGNNQLNWVKAHAFWLIQKTQRGVDLPTWWGAYEKAIDQLKLETARDDAERAEIEAKAVAMADQAVIDSQSGGQTKDLARIQRGGPLMKIFTNFYSYFSATYNLNVEAFRKMQVNKKLSAPQAYLEYMGDLITLNIIPAIMGALIREGLKNECEGDLECIAKKVKDEQIDYLTGMTPLTRELGGGIKALTGGQYFGYQGPPGIRFLSDTQKFFVQSKQGELDDAWRKAFLNVVGQLTHLPAGQLNTIIDGFQAIENGDVEGAGTVLAPLAGPPRE